VTSIRNAPLLALLALAGCRAQGSVGSPSAPPPSSRARAYVGGAVIASPGEAPIADGVVVVEDGRILAVGARSDVAVPAGARVVDCRGATVTAAFWNAHVHFTQPVWSGAAKAPARDLEDALRAMLGRWGFAHVFDTGSNIHDTGALRARIARGEIEGPSILTTGDVFVAKGGQPVYIPFPLPELETPEAARAAVTSVR
jgi:imidazolonepropionase-like amidohydrolase